MDMVARQHTLHDVDTHFFAGLADDLTDTFAHRSLQNLVAVFCDPHDVESVVKSRVRGGEIINKLAEADRLEASGFNPLGGK